ncbi:N-acetylmuramoyl-L-alanine amidase [Cellulomonas sp. DKR-3]|uniref:N-acetylmuramoyl-L-alanine amidase n=1 Tax=Cellulomonas fulva TaxID=2835530 RepID=A0ABS5TZP0_9CELL|nr:N-acetylmuramoyl-L-alanine amidase [Cellulomonas fulva]MBT0994622.1 N-acetylmuramoyl-L-alanine amidase [Cellulomonas fulva]
MRSTHLTTAPARRRATSLRRVAAAALPLALAVAVLPAPAGATVATDARAVAPAVVPAATADSRPGSTRTLALAASAGDPRVATRTASGSRFYLAAVTWDAGAAADLDVRIRVRTASGWSPWATLAAEDDHAPDAVAGARSAEKRARSGQPSDERPGRAGTEPYVTAAADAVQVRVHGDGPLPRGLRLETVDPGIAAPDAAAGGTEPTSAYVTDAQAAGPTVGAATTSGATTAASQPQRLVPQRPAILSRAAWGAQESMRGNYGEDVWYGEIKGGFVHHTAGSNSYSAAEVPAIIRSIYRYHVVSRGWDDIGYNFLVDRFGRIWEGAYGGVGRPVVGAHTKSYNSSSFAMSAIGDFTSVVPSSKVLDAYSALFAWKLGLSGVWDAQGTSHYTYPGSRDQRTIAGHRDTKATACPGQMLYDRLGTIRSGAARRLAAVPARLTLDGPSTAVAGRPTTLTAQWVRGGIPVDGKVNLQRRSGSSWVHVRQLTVTGGLATADVTPTRSTAYRLRASSSTRPVNVALDGSPGTSNTLSTSVRATTGTPSLRLDGAAVARVGDRVELAIVWRAPGGLVDGRVNLQRRSGSSWVHVRQLAVVDGRATTTLTPGGSHGYRLRASSATWPRDVPLAHPRGTSNTYSVTVYPRASAPFA